MSERKWISWTGLALFLLALVLVILLVFAPLLDFFDFISPEALLWAIGVLGLLSSVFGFLSFKTPQGKIAAIGGLLLLLAVVFVIPIRVETKS